jgi:hypothetical protein
MRQLFSVGILLLLFAKNNAYVYSNVRGSRMSRTPQRALSDSQEETPKRATISRISLKSKLLKLKKTVEPTLAVETNEDDNEQEKISEVKIPSKTASMIKKSISAVSTTIATAKYEEQEQDNSLVKQATSVGGGTGIELDDLESLMEEGGKYLSSVNTLTQPERRQAPQAPPGAFAGQDTEIQTLGAFLV